MSQLRQPVPQPRVHTKVSLRRQVLPPDWQLHQIDRWIPNSENIAVLAFCLKDT